MEKRPAWFDACLIGAVFATVLLAASAHVGFFSFLLNLICVGMFVVPMVVAVREGELS
ncbi:MAG: hypothetical protein AB8B97_25095 [Granulosicoccus sp.]